MVRGAWAGSDLAGDIGTGPGSEASRLKSVLWLASPNSIEDMKTVSIERSGKTILMDEDDFRRFGGFNWYVNDNGYVVTDSSKRAINQDCPDKLKLHRLILAIPPGLDVDHINGNRLDNRKSNLRSCTRSQNLSNQLGRGEMKGVYLDKRKLTNPWFVGIQLNGKMKYFGRYPSREEAMMAYKKASLEHHGEFSVFRSRNENIQSKG